MEKIFGLVGQKYDKSSGQMETITRQIDETDIANALKDGQ